MFVDIFFFFLNLDLYIYISLLLARLRRITPEQPLKFSSTDECVYIYIYETKISIFFLVQFLENLFLLLYSKRIKLS